MAAHRVWMDLVVSSRPQQRLDGQGSTPCESLERGSAMSEASGGSTCRQEFNHLVLAYLPEGSRQAH
jgi:hypothetical protein